MQLKVDKESDTLYFRLNEKAIVDSEEVRPGIMFDFDKDGQVVGVEFLGNPRADECTRTRLVEF